MSNNEFTRHTAKGPGRDSNPGQLQWRQGHCTWDARSTNWAHHHPRLLSKNLPSCTYSIEWHWSKKRVRVKKMNCRSLSSMTSALLVQFHWNEWGGSIFFPPNGASVWSQLTAKYIKRDTTTCLHVSRPSISDSLTRATTRYQAKPRNRAASRNCRSRLSV